MDAGWGEAENKGLLGRGVVYYLNTEEHTLGIPPSWYIWVS
jgi:NADH:ubiquinone oxidoreductase subunit